MKTHYQQQPPFEPPDKIGANGRIGLVALATDVNSEADLRRMAPDGVEIFTNRVSYRNPLTKQSLLAMAPDISRAASDLVPGFALDVLIYACTSGTAVIGEAEVMRLLRAGQSDFGDLPCTTPVTAALAALACFSAKKISILTPYVEPVNRELVGVFSIPRHRGNQHSRLRHRERHRHDRCSRTNPFSPPLAMLATRTPMFFSFHAPHCAPRKWWRESKRASTSQSSPAIRRSCGTH